MLKANRDALFQIKGGLPGTGVLSFVLTCNALITESLHLKALCALT